MWVTPEEFQAHVDRGGFLEHAEFLGNRYGTPIPQQPPDKDLVLEIEVQGARQVKGTNPDALFIFVVPPTPEEQERRLRKRGDAEDIVAKRLAKAAEEAYAAGELGAIEVVNDDLEAAVEEIAGIIERAR